MEKKEGLTKAERQLTKAEARRARIYETERERLEAEGYTKKELTIGIILANIMAIVIGIPILVLGVYCFIARNGVENYLDIFVRINLLAFVLIIAVLMAVHELIHGFFWSLAAKDHAKSIEFGFMVKELTPYCCCTEALKRWQYILGLIMPTVLLGIVPAVVAIFIGSEALFGLGALMTMAGGGDCTILLKILCYRSKKTEELYLDHPYKCGLVVFSR